MSLESNKVGIIERTADKTSNVMTMVHPQVILLNLQSFDPILP